MCIPTASIEQDQVEFWLFEVEQDDVCAFSFEAVQQHARWVNESWGRDPEAPMRYELFETRERCWPCASDAGACGTEGRLATTRMPDRHEVAHAAHGTACTSLIEEAWATLYANPFEGAEIVGSLEDVGVAIEDVGRLPGEYYPLAARFVAFVIEGWGIGAVHELCDLRLANKAELDAGLRQVLGLSLAEAQLALDDYPDWSLGQLRQDEACEHDASLSAPFSSTFEIGCDADGVEGLLGHSAWSQAVVDFGEGGSYALNIEALEPVEVWVEVRSCAREGLASLHYSLDVLHPRPTVPAGLLLFDLPGGHHVIRVMDQSSRAELEVGVSVQPWP
jgi:hypothetical protein